MSQSGRLTATRTTWGWSSVSVADVRLALAALTIGLLLGLVLVAPQPLWAGQPFGPPPAGSASTPGIGWAGALIALAFVAALCVPFRPYLHALELARSSALRTRTVVGLTAALAVLAWLMYPRFGSDVFVYAAYERLWTVYGGNPLLAAPALQPADWTFQYVWLPYQPNPYGPLWVVLTWPIVQVAGSSALRVVLGYKLLILGAYIACCALLWSIVPPQRRTRALVLFAWSPLVLFEVLGKAHNDVLLALAALLTLRLAERGGVLSALGGALVKMSGFAAIVAAVAQLARARRWRDLGLWVAAGAALAVLAYAPFWQGMRTLLPPIAQISRPQWSPASVLIVAGLDQATVRITFVAVCAALCGLALWRIAQPAALAAWLFLASGLLLTTAFFAHYLVPVIALAAVAGDARLERAVLWLSFGALAAYGVEPLGLALGSGWIGTPWYQLLRSLVLLAPVTLAFVVPRVAQRIRAASVQRARLRVGQGNNRIQP